MRALMIAFSIATTAACSVAAPDEAPAQSGSGQRAVAVVATGCFWCTESDFDKVPGVLSTLSGYIGGQTANPTYEQVSTGNTGHIESLRVVYDPSRVSFAALVRHALRTSDPTDGGGQFCDRGSQYRPAIFVGSPAERKAADTAKAQAAKQLRRPIATDILPRGRFYPAEGYHQDYYKKNSLKYRYYRLSCGRDAQVKKIWGTLAH